jgi:hypothetical protein
LNILHRHKAFVYAILLLWFFASASGIHGHFCFDGKEPPVSVHFDILSGHDEHHFDGHKDLDSKPGQLDALKVSSFSFLFLITALLLVIVWPLVQNQKYHLFNIPTSWLSIAGLRPPLRAPPIFSRY